MEKGAIRGTAFSSGKSLRSTSHLALLINTQLIHFDKNKYFNAFLTTAFPLQY